MRRDFGAGPSPLALALVALPDAVALPEEDPLVTHPTVSTDLELRLVVPGGPSLPVASVLRYDAADPWAVRVAFQTGPEAGAVVEWIFARSLLTDGVAGAVGEGDVRVWPAGKGRDRVVHLAMASPSGSALFEIDRDELVQFLQQTYLAVPTGCEGDVIDLDGELALLLLDDR